MIPPVTNPWRELWLSLQADSAIMQDSLRRLRDGLDGHESEPHPLGYTVKQLDFVYCSVLRSMQRIREWEKREVKNA